jgi:phage terminase large subunit
MEPWLPTLSPKGLEVFNNYHRLLLLEGARISGKSISAEHKLLRHAIENDGAVIAIITSSKATGDVGIWADLTCPGGIVDQWIAGQNGISYAVPPRYKPDSKMQFFRLRTPPTEDSPYGGEVEFQLHSIFDEKEVERKFKSSRFTMIYITEADNFKRQATLSALRAQLRSFRVPEQRFQIILDTNPPEEGTDHWLHDVFFKKPEANCHRIHFGVDDNPFISANQKQEIFDIYKHDKNLLDRYYYGLWVKASMDGIFSDVFLPNVHVVGALPPRADVTDYESRDQWSILRPDAESFTFEEGWDIGDVNLGYVMGVPRYNEVKQVVCYDIIDELCFTDTMASLSDVVDEVEAKREYWSKWQAEQNGLTRIRWSSWSDSSSLRHRITVNGTEATEIFRLSQQKIKLGGVKKGSGSVARRKDLLKRLLFEQRIYISPICKNVIEMLRAIKGKQGLPIDPTSKHKHIFDALTYMLGYGIPDNNGQQLSKMNRKPMPAVSLAL